jgi:hypothetical protein
VRVQADAQLPEWKFPIVACLGGGRVEVGDVVLEAQCFYTFAGREFRWCGALARRERGRRGVVGHRDFVQIHWQLLGGGFGARRGVFAVLAEGYWPRVSRGCALWSRAAKLVAKKSLKVLAASGM